MPRPRSSPADPDDERDRSRAATREYVDDRMRNAARQGLDQEHLDLLAEDLRSPCSQEVAVFQAFHRLLGRARDQFVIIDTAPDRPHVAAARHHRRVPPTGRELGAPSGRS